ncbi:hypothetical protein R6Z07F_012744 [Ovis aries]|uniref:FAD dependent oxidoreductase domain-containing protein n=1 Tax=Ovis aries TaxID=9940 RepID=A0A835ZS72_SHEEP|nr:hypothetical protein JEQ12_004786 [Ovis aries]
MLHRLLAAVRGPGSRRGWRKGSPARSSASAAAVPPVALPAKAQVVACSGGMKIDFYEILISKYGFATFSFHIIHTSRKRYTRTGSIFLAQTQDRLISLKRINSRLNVVGIPCEIVSPKKVAELHPLLNVHDLVGAMHVPEDAVVSSADVALALASAASQSEPLLSSLLRRMPQLETLEIVKLVNCPETFTPDMRCIVGESPSVRGYFILVGMNSAGLSFGGGAGKYRPHHASLISEVGGHPPDRGLREPTRSTKKREKDLPG